MFDVVFSSLINGEVVVNAFGIVGLFLMIEAGKLFFLSENFPASSELTCPAPDLAKVYHRGRSLEAKHLTRIQVPDSL